MDYTHQSDHEGSDEESLSSDDEDVKLVSSWELHVTCHGVYVANLVIIDEGASHSSVGHKYCLVSCSSS